MEGPADELLAEGSRLYAQKDYKGAWRHFKGVRADGTTCRGRATIAGSVPWSLRVVVIQDRKHHARLNRAGVRVEWRRVVKNGK